MSEYDLVFVVRRSECRLFHCHLPPCSQAKELFFQDMTLLILLLRSGFPNSNKFRPQLFKTSGTASFSFSQRYVDWEKKLYNELMVPNKETISVSCLAAYECPPG